MSSYDFEMDTKKQRQRRRDDARLTRAERQKRAAKYSWCLQSR